MKQALELGYVQVFQAQKKLPKTINHQGYSLTRCAYNGITQQLKAESVGDHFDSKCFAVCDLCCKFLIDAIKAADTLFNGEVASDKHD